MGYYSCYLLVNQLAKPRAESPVSYEVSLIWLCVEVFQLRIYYCIFLRNLQWRSRSAVTPAWTSHVIGKRPCYWLKPFTSVFASLFGFAMQRYYDGTRKKMKTILKTFPDGEQGLSVAFSLLFSLCCISVFFVFFFFSFTLRENVSPVFACVSVFDRPFSPAGLISLGITMFTLHRKRLCIIGLCLCAS